VAAIVKQDVLNYAPELTTISDAAWPLILSFVNTLPATGVGGGEDGPMIELLRILLAAHYATISKRGPTGATGPVTSEAAGPVRRAYGLVALASGDATFGATAYGQQFLGLLSMSLANGPRLV
jgi:hypothetical protein